MARRNGAKVTLISVAHPYFTGGLEVASMIEPQLILDDLKVQLDNSFTSEFAGIAVDRDHTAMRRILCAVDANPASIGTHAVGGGVV